MKSMKKLVLAGLVLLASVVVLVGCKMEAEPEGQQHVHTFGDWKTMQSPTEKTEGRKERVCGICSYSEIKEIEKVPAGFVYIPEGSFQMGSKAGDAANKPVHEVTISKGFYMGKYEVTQEEYSVIMGSNPSNFSSGAEEGENQELRPVENVSWYDAVVYCNELTKKDMEENSCVYYSDKDFKTVYTREDGENKKLPYMNFNKNGYRLPTEAEWEYAARGGNGTTEALIWSGTDKEDELENYAWYNSNSKNKTHEVGMKDPNGYGLCDMSGNVSEWCWDWYAGDYYKQTEGVSDPKGASSGSLRVYRGGRWSFSADYASVSYRSNGSPNYRYSDLGFRVVCASSK